MIQEKMHVLEKVGLSESNLSEKAESASFHSKVRGTVGVWYTDGLHTSVHRWATLVME